MKLHEILLLNKPFKRANNIEWIIYDPEYNNGWFYEAEIPEDKNTYIDIGTSLDLYYKDILADDWEFYA